MVRPRTHRCRRRGRFFRGVRRVGPAGCAGVNQPVVVLAGFFVPSPIGPAALVGRVADVWRGRSSGAQVCCIILT